MLYVILLICLFFSFFILHSLSKDDFVLIRKNISVIQMFDLGILSFILAFIFGRAFLILDTRMVEYAHIIRFFYFLKFPGLSIMGAVVGFVLSLFLLFRGKSAFKRMFDIYAVSSFPLFLFVLFHFHSIKFGNAILMIGTVILSVLFFVFIKSHKSFILRDGSASLIMLILVSMLSVYTSIFSISPKIIFSLSFTGVASGAISVIAICLLCINERTHLIIKHAK